MLMFTDTALIAFWRGMVVPALVVVLCCGCASAQQMTPLAQVTPVEYEAILKRALRCPEPTLREPRDHALCLVIVPPGHRPNERELLVFLSSVGGRAELLLREPISPLWQLANEAKAAAAPGWDQLPGLKIRTYRSADAAVVSRVAGQSWTKLRTDVVPQGDWFTDPTQYRIRAHTLAGDVSLDLSGPGAAAKVQPSDLLAWAEGVRARAALLLADEAPVGSVP